MTTTTTLSRSAPPTAVSRLTPLLPSLSRATSPSFRIWSSCHLFPADQLAVRRAATTRPTSSHLPVPYWWRSFPIRSTNLHSSPPPEIFPHFVAAHACNIVFVLPDNNTVDLNNGVSPKRHPFAADPLLSSLRGCLRLPFAT